jgi:hypothetical protein
LIVRSSVDTAYQLGFDRPLPWFRGYRHTGDPRLLTPGTGGPLRRDRYASFLVDIAALVVVSLLSRRPLITGDHMIWNYRTQLLAIAAAPTGPRLEPAL